MMILLTIIHVLVCVFLVIVVLLQSGKAADLAGAFGGMGSQTAFGPRGAATVLSKATTIAAGLFMVTSLTLAILATKNAGTGSSVLERQSNKSTTQKSAPATPGQPAPGQPAPAGVTPSIPPPAGGQPSVTLDYGGGNTKTMPLDLNKLPKLDPNAPPPAPAPAAPAKK
ncbi:MAG TPA: preprotein translocase subunit SecG [Bryobacteraceae bacterium]|nr:preprotein translocase subunit SecG [Bryobacteraceae bacterium]